MAAVRRATDKDATWARAWTAATFTDLATIAGPRHGDVAYVTDEAAWYVWRDTGSWQLHLEATAAGKALLSAADAAAQRTALGLGAAALQTYLEGTWTPAITFGGGNTGITYSVQTGVYKRVGKIVWVNATIGLSNKGSSTGAMAITGLPFTVIGNTPGFVQAASMSAGNSLSLVLNSGATDAALHNFAAGVDTTITDTSVLNFSKFNIAAVYSA